MTPQTILKVDLREIAAIEVTCLHCGGLVSIPLSTGNFPRSLKCPGCNEQWWDEENTYREMVKLFLGVGNWNRSENKLFKLQFPVVVVKSAHETTT